MVSKLSLGLRAQWNKMFSASPDRGLPHWCLNAHGAYFGMKAKYEKFAAGDKNVARGIQRLDAVAAGSHKFNLLSRLSFRVASRSTSSIEIRMFLSSVST
jgi:hypothetical protein